MKFSYSLIKKLLPRTPSKAKLIEALNTHSFEVADAPGDVFEVALPPNRYSDAASHIGIAREAGAVLGLNFRNPVKTIVNPPENKGFIKLDVRDAKLCPRYAARYFELKSEIGHSPKWMQETLRFCGLKPINSIVDIMNYVMLETGQPLHAFDADRLAGKGKRRGSKKIIVRRARKGERISTLDGQKVVLGPDVLVIADEEKPAAIAGIKGGQNFGVTGKTRRIIVESANFNPVFIYKAARKLKLQTDASLRFGHGISPALVSWGLDRATELLLKAGAWLLDTVDNYPKPPGEEVIEFSPAKYEAVIGAPIDRKKAEKYFAALGFSVEPLKKKTRDAEAFLVRIPPWRTDIEKPEGLIEEIARLEGYGKFKPRAPLVSAFPARQEDSVSLKDKIHMILLGLRLDEAHNSTFVGKGPALPWLQRGEQIAGGEWHGRRVSPVELENPISEDRSCLRSSLVPLLLKNAEDNARFFDQISIFEMGKVFSAGKRGPEERLSLGIVLAAKKEPKLILEMKGIADELMRGLGIDDFSIIEAGDSLRVEVGHQVLGILGHALFEKGWHAAFAEFDLDKVMQFTEEAKEFIPLKRFPAVLRDISILASKNVRIGDVVQEIQEANRKLIENVDLIDEYTPLVNVGGPPSPRGFGPLRRSSSEASETGKQSLTFRIIFQAEDRTLTDEEVNKEMGNIVDVLQRKFRAEVR